MKKIVTAFTILLFSLVGCSPQEKLSEPIVESIESELFRLKVEIPSALIKEGEDIKVSGTLTYLGNKPIELMSSSPPILLSLAGQGGGTEDIALITEMVPGDVITIEQSFTLTNPGIYSLKTATTELRVNGEYVEGAGYENLEAPHPRFQESFESKLSLDPIEITVK